MRHIWGLSNTKLQTLWLQVEEKKSKWGSDPVGYNTFWCREKLLIRGGLEGHRVDPIDHDFLISRPFFQRSQKSYFCQDNNSFGESEAKVFCSMLGWPMGKTKPKAPNNKSGLYSTVSCDGDEMHILDCDTNIISQVMAVQMMF